MSKLETYVLNEEYVNILYALLKRYMPQEHVPEEELCSLYISGND